MSLLKYSSTDIVFFKILSLEEEIAPIVLEPLLIPYEIIGSETAKGCSCCVSFLTHD